eukprot:CAMPEP_0173459648 /NCGR_PEP_ID=MMETSP1357-20121228/61781_1 /TAXON_ID=77926 /ORGANISM="Hemiselmis rufescens, Strain PCC563" /LENGTH=166 /DNA_ID=CAMNT_0014427129 /DNA_START=161 /DNA_END=657 /DNA_ORIENTATION=+
MNTFAQRASGLARHLRPASLLPSLGRRGVPGQARHQHAVNYVEEMRASWQKDPASVHPTWQDYFTKAEVTASQDSAASDEATTPEEVNQHCADHIKMLLLVRSFQIRGHYMVKLDPLGINDGNLHVDKMEYRGGEDQAMETPRLLDYSTYGFTEADLHKQFFLNAG